MKAKTIGAAILCLTAVSMAMPFASASAQTADMSCADYLKLDQQANAQLTAEAKAMLQADPQAKAMDDKLRAYCTQNPKVPMSEAAQKALMP